MALSTLPSKRWLISTRSRAGKLRFPYWLASGVGRCTSGPFTGRAKLSSVLSLQELYGRIIEPCACTSTAPKQLATRPSKRRPPEGSFLVFSIVPLQCACHAQDIRSQPLLERSEQQVPSLPSKSTLKP